MMAVPDNASIGSEESIRKSDSQGAVVVWIIIAALTLAAGFVAWRLLAGQKEQSLSGNSSLSQAADPSTTASTTPTPEVAPGPGQANVSSPPAAPEGMVFVPGGIFNMGRDDGDEFESPAHPVEVKPFFIDRTEVTNEEYQRFVSAVGYRAPVHWVGGVIPKGQEKFPVVNVSWDDAKAYARWVNKRLPTEAEWEFAARGTDGRIYPWGVTWRQDHANAGHGASGGLVEVGRYVLGASPFGALDMCGNAWEWTASDFEDYPGHKVASSLAGAGLKVIRGGAFDVAPKRATTTYRGAIPPDRIPDKTGFRCVRDAQ
jgi:serine/threonine-protein kinase